MKASFIVAMSLFAALGAGTVHAADMPVKAIPKASAPVLWWTGGYLGFNGGYGWRKEEPITFAPNDPLEAFITCGGGIGGTCALPAFSKLQGGSVGFQAGYNWQIAPSFLVGVETDIQAARIEGRATNPTFRNALVYSTFQTSQQVNWFGTLRGRVGFLANQGLLIYATGGLAYGRVKQVTHLIAANEQGAFGLGFAYTCVTGDGSFPLCFTGDSARWRAGWTAGAGIEFTAWKNVTVKAEYVYVNLGGGDTFKVQALSNAAFNVPGTPLASFMNSYGKPDFNVVRVGLNYHFAPPVVARY
jgi:outer membrane immunogenic protein